MTQESPDLPSPPKAPTKPQRCFSWRRVLRILLLDTLLFLALGWSAIFAIREWVLPDIANEKPAIEAELSSLTGRPVTLDAVSAEWQGWRPHLAIRGLTLYTQSRQPALRLDAVNAELAWSSLTAGKPVFSQLEILSPHLSMARDGAGNLSIAGLPLQQTDEDSGFGDWLLRQQNILIRNAELDWRDDQRHAPPLLLKQVSLSLKNDGDTHTFTLSGVPAPELGGKLSAEGALTIPALDNTRDWSGKISLTLPGYNLALWQQWLPLPVAISQGHATVKSQLMFKPRQPVTINADLTLTQLIAASGAELPLLATQQSKLHLEGSLNSGKAQLSTEHLQIELPQIFAEAEHSLQQLQADLSWQRNGQAADAPLDLTLHKARFHNAHASGGEAQGRYRYLPDQPGIIDLTAHLGKADGNVVWRYLPKALNAEARDWVRAAITAGKGHDAQLILRGDLRQFPFRNPQEGLFRVTAKITEGELHYAPSWPVITDIHGTLLFEGARMLIKAEQGNILGARLGHVSAEIPDLDAGEERKLHIHGQAQGETRQFLDFISLSPVREQINGFTDHMKAEGKGALSLQLVLPLEHLEHSKVKGDYQFTGNKLWVVNGLPPIQQAAGTLTFTESTLGLKGGSGRLFNEPLTISAQTRNDGNVVFQAQGGADLTAVRKEYGERKVPLEVSGKTPWSATIAVLKQGVDVRVDASLKGITSSLPEPLNKPSAATPWPVRFEWKPFEDGSKNPIPREQLRLSVGGATNPLLLVHLIRRQEARLGITPPHETPRPPRWVPEKGLVSVLDSSARLPERGLAVSANLKRLDWENWSRWLPEDSTTPAAASDEDGWVPPITGLNLSSEEAIVYGHVLNHLKIRSQPDDTGFNARISSDEASGDIRWRNQGKGRLFARFSKLALEESNAPATNNPTPASAPDTLSTSDTVHNLPAIDLIAEQFILGGRPLGRLEIYAQPKTEAWHIEKFNLSNPDGKLTGSGEWKAFSQNPTTRMMFTLESPDVGNLLGRFGFADMVKRGKAELSGQLGWPGAPTQFAVRHLEGQFKLDVERGQFAKLEPGVGRLLGVISLQTLPRRITLDFRDVFSEGFAFDEIKGTIAMQRGVLRTQDFQVQGPAAQIKIKGEANLTSETQNLSVRVQPTLTESVALGASLASSASAVNPVTGAIAYLAQKLLRDPFEKIFAYEYSVTGGWADPKVEKTGSSKVDAADTKKP